MNFWLITSSSNGNEDYKLSPRDKFEKRACSHKVWGLANRKPNHSNFFRDKEHIQAGDALLFYLCSPINKFVGTFIASTNFQFLPEEIGHLSPFHSDYGVFLKGFIPFDIEPALKDVMPHFESITAIPEAGAGRLSKKDFNTVLTAANANLQSSSEGFVERNSIRADKAKVMYERYSRGGQSAFRKALLDCYGGECAVTGTCSEFVLDAAHIIGHAEGGVGVLSNGILLRVDIHRLFDLGLLVIDGKLEIKISEELRDTPYNMYKGQEVKNFEKLNMHVSLSSLEEHYQAFLKGAKKQNLPPIKYL